MGDHWSCREEGAMVAEKCKREKSTQGNTQEHFPPKTQAGKMRGADFCDLVSSSNQQALKTGVLKVNGLGGDRAPRVLPHS